MREEPAVAEGRLPPAPRCPGFSVDPWLFITTQSSGDADVTSRLAPQECTLLVPLPASPTPVPPSRSATSSRCFFLMLHWRREGRKSLIMCSSGGLGKGVGGVGSVRVQAEDQVYGCVEPSAAQARTAASSARPAPPPERDSKAWHFPLGVMCKIHCRQGQKGYGDK